MNQVFRPLFNRIAFGIIGRKKDDTSAVIAFSGKLDIDFLAFFPQESVWNLNQYPGPVARQAPQARERRPPSPSSSGREGVAERDAGCGKSLVAGVLSR